MNDNLFDRYFNSLERGISGVSSLLKAAGLGILIAVAAFNFDVILSGFRGVVQQLPRLTKVSAIGVTAEFDTAGIAKSVKASDVTNKSLRANWKDEQSQNAAEGLKSLDKRGLTRLLTVGLLQNVCRFEKPNGDMLTDIATDKLLEEKEMVTLEPQPATLQKVREDIRKREALTGKPSDIGYPTDCYNPQLTKKGFDVRTAIVQGVAESFQPEASK
jgi:hypothetical protein